MLEILANLSFLWNIFSVSVYFLGYASGKYADVVWVAVCELLCYKIGDFDWVSLTEKETFLCANIGI